MRSLLTVPSGPVSRSTSASSSRDTGVLWSPRTRGLVFRGSDVTVTSASTRVYSSASPGTGPLRVSAPWSPATVAPAAAQSSTPAAAVVRSRACGCPPGARPATPVRLARAAATTRGPARSARAAHAQSTAPAAAHRPDTPSVSPAAAHVAKAGGTSRRSTGPSCRGSAEPSRRPEAAWTSGPVTAGPVAGGPRTACRRSRRPHEVRRRTGNPRARCGSR